MMPSIQRPLSGDVLLLDLEEERERTTDAGILERSGRSGRTLVKDGPLRVTLVVLAAGGSLAEHEADGPITVQPLDGRVRFDTADGSWDLGPGDLLAARAGVRHSVASEGGASFLLTVALAGGREGRA
jgi:quercetin dioxygenase-like cupin family protein